ncbi:exosome complex exonuclease DIS3/RRP44 [Nematocida sp. LUAm3]|nr:exosome complex exonuclease DIS3/RRP44 [Nematocida sp. LUAm3]KAI5175983.1 exosome complex exonuclease DIS3/RRP44 [Nematocida sp. LUAm2]KAI5179079.1 exosome complex exonuclease DIS3/RRP44 [Nematocida sp. LUAm1]
MKTLVEYKIKENKEIVRSIREVYLQDTFLCGFSCCNSELISEDHKGTFYLLSASYVKEGIPIMEVNSNLLVLRSSVEQIEEMDTLARIDRMAERRSLIVVEDSNSLVLQEYTRKHSNISYYEGILNWYKEHIPSISIELLDGLPSPCSVDCPNSEDISEKLSYELPDGLPVHKAPISVKHFGEGGRIRCPVEGQQMDIKIEEENMHTATDQDIVSVVEIEEGRGKVVKVERRSKRGVPCSVAERISSTHYLMQPNYVNYPKFLVCSTEELIGKVVLCWISGSRGTNSKNTFCGRVIRVLGGEEEVEAETQGILMYNSIVTQSFSWGAQMELPASTWTIPQEEFSSREDFRDLPICSIDPEGCVDIDDALHCRMVDGVMEIGVHIADVTYFVREDSELDREGRIRGCSVYLPDRRIDMLPTVLGTNLCSLHKNKERLTFSVIWRVTIKENLRIIDKKFIRSIIRSKEAFTYEEASDILKGRKKTSKEIEESLFLLKRASSFLKKERIDNGAFLIPSSDSFISAKGIKSFSEILRDPKKFVKKEEDMLPEYDTHSLVEEMMLLANRTVAEEMISNFPFTSLIRMHPTPSSDAFKELEKAVNEVYPGVQLDPQNPREISFIIQKIKNESPALGRVIGHWASMCMTQALYASSSFNHHYGLGMEAYTHFTSPIRRYADILVHRITLSLMQSKSSSITEHALERVCKSINRSHRSSKYAAREANNLYSRYLLPEKEIILFITSLSPKIEVFSPEYNIMGTLISAPEHAAILQASPLLSEIRGVPIKSDAHNNAHKNAQKEFLFAYAP